MLLVLALAFTSFAAAGDSSRDARSAAEAKRQMSAVKGPVVFGDDFEGADGLITNGWANWNPTDPRAVVSTNWEARNGSVFRRDGRAWSGVPDDCAQTATSVPCTGSAWMHLYTKRADFGNVLVQSDVTVKTLASGPTHPAQDWDGVHLWLRYQDDYHLYAASVNQRDGKVFIKKKCPGGPQNGGTYYIYGQSTDPIPFGARQTVAASARNNADGSVTITVYREGVAVLSAVDRGELCPPITAAGHVGVRGTNADFEFDRFRVFSLR